jgi:hypothetical protein
MDSEDYLNDWGRMSLMRAVENSHTFTISARFRAMQESLSDLIELVSSSNLRFVVPAASVLAWKAIVSLYLFARIGGFQDFDTAYTHVYLGWDSFWYTRIAESGYQSLSQFAFFPLYPLIIRAFYLVTHDIVLSAGLPAYIFGIGFAPLFQVVAEQYMDRQSAIRCTLIAVFFPVVFVFTSIAYSESIFLFLSLLFWIEYKSMRVGRASLVWAIASLTRTFGILLGIPLVLELVKKRQVKSSLYLAIPAFSILAWLYYGFVSTGNWLAFRQAQVSSWSQADWFSTSVLPFFAGRFSTFQPLSFFMIVIVGFLVYLTFQEDWRLGVLSLVMYASIILFAGPPELSYLRYFSFVFPIWLLAGRVRSWSLLLVYCVFMSISSMMMWYQFVVGFWVG